MLENHVSKVSSHIGKESLTHLTVWFYVRTVITEGPYMLFHRPCVAYVEVHAISEIPHPPEKILRTPLALLHMHIYIRAIGSQFQSYIGSTSTRNQRGTILMNGFPVSNHLNLPDL